VPEILRGQVFVSAAAADGALIDAAGLQVAGVLDELYSTDAPLGVNFDGDVPTLSVWAPTAQNVRLHLFADSDAETEADVLDMSRDDATGVWSITGEADWIDQYYLYEVMVYAPAAGEIVTNLVTDPYSLSLSLNSTRSQIVNLDDPALFPEGWAESARLEALAPEDRALYELHIRDFSAFDSTVPEELRGTYMAFTVMDSAGMQHLAAAADAGLTDVHLLPAFDIASINENAAERAEPDPAELASFPPDSDQQTALIDAIRDQDAFNWGYDPFHYNAPEGSYATDPEGGQRIREFRAMVQALNSVGLRVVMDVVYNHTNSSGQSDRSVLDRVVPGYYHRYNNDGRIATSTCCQNTATENAMMERLMVDSVLMWARDYHVDGFRFDLMGHHLLRNMVAVRDALDSLTVADDGVDGTSIYVYGEGWDFGEVGANGRGINATQLNIGGSGIGVFNDRVRDAARGGNPFGGFQEQGFIDGLYDDPNGITPGTPEEQLARLLLFSDQIRVNLAGNLRDYPLVNAAGETVTGADIDYNGSPAGYTLDPQENIVYIAAHDNETLWDAIQYKAPEDADINARVRMNNLGISLVALSQGVPFFHAGDDMLRSKSMDGNSYNSGDWFNRLDFTYNSNNWAVGLPPSRQDNWEIIGPLLANPDLAVAQEDILNSVMHFREMLSIRQSSPLFRLQTADDVIERLTFLNTGPDQIPGLIVMALDDTGGVDLDPNAEQIAVLFNATTADVTFSDATFDGAEFALHPVQQSSHDPVVQGASYSDGAFTVPGRTTAVFVLGE
jgi:pullulanase